MVFHSGVSPLSHTALRSWEEQAIFIITRNVICLDALAYVGDRTLCLPICVTVDKHYLSLKAHALKLLASALALVNEWEDSALQQMVARGLSESDGQRVSACRRRRPRVL